MEATINFSLAGVQLLIKGGFNLERHLLVIDIDTIHSIFRTDFRIFEIDDQYIAAEPSQGRFPLRFCLELATISFAELHVQLLFESGY